MKEFEAESSRIVENRVGKNVSPIAPQISIIIPAYNVAEFITDTLDSVLSQTFRDYEILLINDGSPDTEALEKKLASYFDNLIYIKQKNGGVGSARNSGISI